MRGVRGSLLSSFPSRAGFLATIAVMASAVLVTTFADPAEARKRRSEPEKVAKKETKPLERPKQPVLIVISIPKQRMTVYAGSEKIAEAPVSTGQRGFETPTGVFTLLAKSVQHFSNLYGGAPMPYMQRLTWSGVALHAGVLPGYPASHGCIRLPHSFAKSLFGITSLGARVLIVKDDITPAYIDHGKLISPLPSEVSAMEASPTRVTESGGIEVAATETSGADSGFLSGMSRAAAAAAGPPRPRTREEALAMRAAELTGYEDAVKAAEASRKDAEARLEAALLALRAAQKSVEPAREEAEKLARLARKAEAGKEDAQDQLAELTRRAEKRPTDKNLKALEERKPILEEKIKAAEANGAPARALSDEAAKELERRVAEVRAKDTERDAAAAAVKSAGETIKTAQQALLNAKRAMARRDLPISIFVSRKAGRLFVRQGYEPIGEAPVTIERPDQPIGTHVFTAVEATENGNALRWNVMTIPTRVVLAAEKETIKRKGGKTEPANEAPNAAQAASTEPPPPQTPETALDRVTFPDETKELLTELVKPGSTLLISDYGISNETGKYTDFIILTQYLGDAPRVKKTRRVRATGYAPRRRYRPPPLSFW